MAKPTTIRSERMRTYLDTMKHESILLGPVDRYLQLLTDDRPDNVIHPTEMAASTWCPRATWHRLVGHTRPVEVHRLRTNLVFTTGDDTHEKWQRWTREMGILWGLWRCEICDKHVLEWSNSLDTGPCAERTSLGRPSHIWKYKEVPLVDPTHRIVGHADGIVNPTGEEPFVLEVKSVGPGTIRKLDLLDDDENDDMSSTKFSKISRPENNHFRQLQIYLRLAEVIKEDVGPIERGVFIYEHKADQQVREFIVTRNDRWTDHLFDTATDILWAIAHGRDVKCPYGDCAQCKSYEGVA